EIDDFEIVMSVQVLFAQARDVAHGADGFWRLAGYEETQHVIQRRRLMRLSLHIATRLGASLAKRGTNLVRTVEIEPDQHTFGIRQIADDAPDRLRKLPDQCRDCDNLIALRKTWILHQVDDVDVVATRKMRLAQPLQVGDGGHGFRCLTSNI